MRAHSRTIRESARRLFLTGEVTSIAEIARRVKAKPHTIASWRKVEDWDGLRVKIERQAAEKLVDELANERVTLNSNHFKLWSTVIARVYGTLAKEGGSAEQVRALDRTAAILERAQRGQRLARGLSSDGQTEEQIRAEAAADCRKLADLFFDVVKDEVEDEAVRDRIARRIFERLPLEGGQSDA